MNVSQNIPPVGERNATIRDLELELGRKGASNHEIFAAMSALAEQCGKYSDETNLYEKWTRLLGIIREIRAAGIQVQSTETEPSVHD